MKKIIIILTTVFITAGAVAQAPDKMSYQAVIRDASNNLVSNQAVGMQISIIQGSANGTAVYTETQTPLTNANGLISIEIGSGTPVLGVFGSINWAYGPYFIKTETDPLGGINYTITGTSQLLSVPYALHANKADTALYAASAAPYYAGPGINILGNTISTALDNMSGTLNIVNSTSLNTGILSNDSIVITSPGNYLIIASADIDADAIAMNADYYSGGAFALTIYDSPLMPFANQTPITTSYDSSPGGLVYKSLGNNLSGAWVKYFIPGQSIRCYGYVSTSGTPTIPWSIKVNVVVIKIQ